MLLRITSSIGARLIAGYLLIAALALGMGVVGHLQIDRVRRILVDETTECAEARYLSTKIRAECLQVSSLLDRFTTQTASRVRLRLSTLLGDEAAVLRELASQMSRQIRDRCNGNGSEELQIWGEIEVLLRRYLQLAHAVVGVEEGWDLADDRQGGPMSRFQRARAQLLEQLVRFEDLQTSRLYVSRRTAQETVRRARLITMTLGVVALLGGVLLGWGISRTITRPVGRLVEAAQRIAAGDLEHLAAVDSRCEVGVLARAFNQMAVQLRELIGRLEQRLDELHQTQAALQASEEHYRSLFTSVPVGLYQSTPDGQIRNANPALVQMLGAPNRETLLRVNAADLYLIPETRLQWQDLMASEEVVSGFEAQFRRFDNQSIWVRNSGRAVRDAEGTVLCYEGILEDVTERRQAESEREALIAELEEKSDEMERFTYTVSHDLKSPLITITGFLSFLESSAREGDLDRLREDIGHINSAAEAMRQLLEELLELSRIGRVKNVLEPVALTDLACEAKEMVAGRLTAGGVEVDIAPDLPTVLGDRARLRAVLANLLDNAVKFMGDQTTPRIEIAERLDDGEPVLFVRDNGIGLEPGDGERIFGLFEKLSAEAEGTGMGLTIVKRIIEVHGGRIWVESQGVGHGSTFCFTLPGRKSG